MNTKTILAALAALALGMACTPSEPEVEETVSQKITASVADNGSSAKWAKTDVIGVYTDASENNVKYTTSSAGASVTFTASTEVKGAPKYAYYPYSTGNASLKATGLKGSIAKDQTAGVANYMYGVQTGTNNDGDATFEFHKMFADVVFTVETAGSVIEGQEVESINVKVTREGAAVPVCGEFSYSAADGSYSYSTSYNEFTTAGKAVVFPTVKAGDVLIVTAKSADAEAVAELTVEGDVVAGGYYEVNVQLPAAPVVEPEEPETPEEPEQPSEPETPAVAGTFTAATYNVDGLPKKISFFTINGDGPGSDGTKNISKKIASDNWDFVGFSEDFAYHTELTSALSGWTFGKYRGNISSKALTSTIDTDGLGFAARNATCSFSNENIVKFTSSSGGLTSGANTCIKKGFRHYVMTLADGTQIDVIITHMNTYSSSGSGRINAQHAQLKQIAQYVNGLKANNRPIIIMGDTNCRYTRHDFQTYFWGVLDSSFEVKDPWVEFQWDGVYPTYGGKSLMVSDATGTNSSTDIICENTQKGEVVDKIIYINNPDAPVQISANSYLRDYDGYNGLADHMPIVVEFSYTVAK